MTPEKIFAELNRFIALQRAALEEDKFHNCDGLDEKVAELCDGLKKMPIEKRAEYAAQLNQLTESLQELSTTLRLRKDELQEEISRSPNVVTAHKLYRKVESSGKGEGEK